MQGKNTNVIKFVNALKAFKAKLANWKRKDEIYNFAMLEKVDMLLDSREESSMPEVVEKDIVKHLSNLQNEFDRYFLETSDEELDFARNPFTFSVEKLSNVRQDKFLELINDSGARQEYHEKPFSHLWVGLKDSYPQTTETALRILIPLYQLTYASQDFRLYFKLRPNIEIDLRLRMICVVHCHKLYPASNYFQKTNKNKFHIDLEEN